MDSLLLCAANCERLAAHFFFTDIVICLFLLNLSHMNNRKAITVLQKQANGSFIKHSFYLSIPLFIARFRRCILVEDSPSVLEHIASMLVYTQFVMYGDYLIYCHSFEIRQKDSGK